MIAPNSFCILLNSSSLLLKINKKEHYLCFYKSSKFLMNSTALEMGLHCERTTMQLAAKFPPNNLLEPTQRHYHVHNSKKSQTRSNPATQSKNPTTNQPLPKAEKQFHLISLHSFHFFLSYHSSYLSIIYISSYLSLDVGLIGFE